MHAMRLNKQRDLGITTPLHENLHIFNIYVFSSMASKPNKSAGLEVVLSHTAKLCVASNYAQLSTNIKYYKVRMFFNLFQKN